MNEIDHIKLASLMAVNREVPSEDHSVRDTSLSRAIRCRIAPYSLATLGVLLVARGEFAKTDLSEAITELKASDPHHRADPVSALGLHEVIAVRNSEQPQLNLEFSRSFLSSALSNNQAHEVLAIEGDYKHRLDSKGRPIPDEKVAILQSIILGPSESDGLFGPKSAQAFRATLEAINLLRSEQQKIACPPQGQPFELTVGMARELIEWAVTSRHAATKDVQQGLRDLQFSVGATGVDGKIGPSTIGALQSFWAERGASSDAQVDLAAAVAALHEKRPSAREELEAQINHSDWFSGLPEGWQQRFISAARACREATQAGVMSEFLNSPAFTGIPENLQCKLLEVFENTDLVGRCHLVNLCHRQSPTSGRLTILESCGEIEDNRPKVIIDYLYDLAVDPLQEKDQQNRAQILAGCLAELDPFNVNQGPWGRCTGDVIHYDLNLRYPAQAARLAAQTFSRSGEVTTPLGTIYNVPEQDGYDPAKSISVSEARIHSFLLEAGDPFLRYDLRRDCQVNPVTDLRVGASMSNHRVAELMSELCGEKHICYSASDGIAGSTLALLLRHCEPGDKFAYLCRLMTDEEIAQLSEAEKGGNGEYWSSHIVNFVDYRPEEGSVLFRTWGRAPGPAGTKLPSERQSLEMIIVDELRGIYSVQVAALESRLTAVITREDAESIDPERLDRPWQLHDLLKIK